MTPIKPYLLRAHYEWLADNGCTPLLVVDVNAPGVRVPPGVAQDGQVILNISMSAVRDLELDNELISFGARFSGSPFAVLVPMDAVLGLVARENGQGIGFQASPADQGASDDTQAGIEQDDPPDDEPPRPKGPGLRIVK